ncbi:hypothetical protein [Tenacibaculum piscium]|uniref:Uncharacterized protein n=1 Tax=Tenacibaculum piscium TaxID=1458515 RepID=A0A2H1YEM7_9FLAO|nr:hypothetical protein [Tenacibaculum piscium]MBE7628372.1 hypothetical protein [Tenacibaculum piscium]MBE7669529.1 hypothetical protein [Tenacibaculum piscium]SOS73956.1 conserved hypothetical protein [Tenacibaculum piscium]
MEMITAYDFELNLELKGIKNPSKVFNHLADFYDKLLILDKHIVYNISVDTSVEYNLVAVDFETMTTKIKQVFLNVPARNQRDIDNVAWLGALLVYIKYKTLKAIELQQISSKKGLDKLTDEINRKIKKEAPSHLLLFSVNNYYVLNCVKAFSVQASKLKRGEYFCFKIGKNKAKLTSKSFIDVPKILNELGDGTIAQERVEVLKINTMDLLSDSSCWTLKREGTPIDVKITDEFWLSEYHARKFVIQPNDYLKFNLKIIHTTSSNTQKPQIRYEATKIMGVIPPSHIENHGQLEIPY